MPSHLELLPIDILSYIVFLCVEATPFEPLKTILQLLLTSRTINEALSSCPHLYACIFRERFDCAAVLRRSTGHLVPASWLALELRRRSIALLRARLARDATEQELCDDLTTLYLMCLENDGLNQIHIQGASVPSFVHRLVVQRLRQNVGDFSWPLETPAVALAAAIMALTWTRDDINKLTCEEREELLTLLRPFTMPMHEKSLSYACIKGSGGTQLSARKDLIQGDTDSGASIRHEIVSRCRGFSLSHPNLRSSAIFLTFVLKETLSIRAPHHLLPTRAAAEAVQRSGPTMEDYTAFARMKTPLVADAINIDIADDIPRKNGAHRVKDKRASRSLRHDADFFSIARNCNCCSELHSSLPSSPAYVPGTLSGLWEGSMMVSPLSSSSSAPRERTFASVPDFLSRQPWQCRFREFLPLPLKAMNEAGDPQATYWGGGVQELEVDRNLLTDLESPVKSHYVPDVRDVTKKLHEGGMRDARVKEAHEIVILGETPPEFDAAWGGFYYRGTARTADGLITLKRQPKDSGDERSGTWTFSGRIMSGQTFVGTWHSGCDTDEPCKVEGIFSLSKPGK
ncbi:hypothetical protein CONPUDRAFT_146468 [Coniophora puteana RWD-64-598 SS2]|uniref:F-box domain-containing protein n=1 Tax=Coniophora puteana (strain RWD-64-598) TaxID=741705 RepID=A0A5M3MC93_CONPW|nr:uncharacterized protein CONPUDRAFT_146468 [Coniophora puteana RWD-64-598 SS2]EIW76646.1 hypothetical protein CONPUDRAFT_146468 [Coniophora puteana RWD-64-598 SS2]